MKQKSGFNTRSSLCKVRLPAEKPLRQRCLYSRVYLKLISVMAYLAPWLCGRVPSLLCLDSRKALRTGLMTSKLRLLVYWL